MLDPSPQVPGTTACWYVYPRSFFHSSLSLSTCAEKRPRLGRCPCRSRNGDDRTQRLPLSTTRPLRVIKQACVRGSPLRTHLGAEQESRVASRRVCPFAHLVLLSFLVSDVQVIYTFSTGVEVLARRQSTVNVDYLDPLTGPFASIKIFYRPRGTPVFLS